MITVNGEHRELPEGATVAYLVTELTKGHGGRGVAVALNGDVLPRASWGSTEVSDGDRLEVLTATQGG